MAMAQVYASVFVGHVVSCATDSQQLDACWTFGSATALVQASPEQRRQAGCMGTYVGRHV